MLNEKFYPGHGTETIEKVWSEDQESHSSAGFFIGNVLFEVAVIKSN